MKYKTILLISAMLAGCVSGYQQFYNPIVDPRTLNDAVLLAPDQDPQIYGSDNFEQDTLTLQSKNYILIGYSSFNGALEAETGAIAQAKRLGATVVLVASQYTNTQTTTSTLFLPTTTTTYHSGNLSGNTTYNSFSSGYLGSSSTYGTYTGTSTTYGTQAVPITTHQRRYDQTAYYFVESTKQWRVGVLYDDLTIEQRKQYGRNTGVYIGLVIENTPAYLANVLPGDVLIEINDDPVINVNQIDHLWDKAVAYKKFVKLKVIRQGKERIITVKLGTLSKSQSAQISANPSLVSEGSAIDYFGQAEEEADTGKYDKNLWAKALVDAEGDETKRKVKYIELRANQLFSEKVGAIEAGELKNNNLPRKNYTSGDQNENLTRRGDVTGRYVSQITTEGSWYFNKPAYRRIVLSLVQNGSEISGGDSSTGSEIVEASRTGNVIKFKFWSSMINPGDTVAGEWKISEDGTKLEGRWHASSVSGKWDLTRIE